MRRFNTRREILRIALEALQEPQLKPVYFKETGHNLSDSFLRFFYEHQEGLLLGPPITEPFQDENGRKVQYFENTRLEEYPEHAGTPYEVQLGLLTDELMKIGHTEDMEFGTINLAPEFFYKHGAESFFGRPIWGIGEFRDGSFWQYTQRFMLIEYPEIEVPARFAQAYKRYVEEGKGRPKLLWPGEVGVFAQGKNMAAILGLNTDPVKPDENAIPYSPTTWDRDKKIEVDLRNQTLSAFIGNIRVLQVDVSTGRDGFWTPTGRFSVRSKRDVMDYMSPFPERANYNVKDVPFNMNVVGDVFIHGTYWHSEFGTRRSAGCVNLNLDDADWLYKWAPIGTPVTIK